MQNDTAPQREGMRAIRYDRRAAVPYFIDVLRKRRVELGWSQETLAEKLCWHQQRISGFEHGNKPIHPRLLTQWAAALGMEITALLIPDEDELIGG